MLRKTLLVLGCAAALGAGAVAQNPMAQLDKARGAVSKPALVERYGGDAQRRGELRLPKGKGPFPVAVLIHGGCWTTMEDLSGMAPLADLLAQRGIATWNIEYRRHGDPGGGWPGTLEDVGAGIDHLRKLGKRHPIDLKRIAIVGHSSGAHLALWGAARPKLRDKIAGRNPLRPLSAVAIDGPGHLKSLIGPDEQVCGKAAIVPFMGGTPEQKPDAYRAATPADHLPLGVRQLLVKAELAPFMEPYEKAAVGAGDTVKVLTPKGADHFNLITPGTRQADEVADFIAAHAVRR
jgi:dienelactone hydrolase